MKRTLYSFLLLFLILSCSQRKKKQTEFPTYEGPVMEADSSTILYSDSAVVRIKITAPKQFEYENGDNEFPNKIFIEFYEPSGELSSTLEANKGYFTKETNLYKATGDVEVIGYLEPQKLNTEELYWDPEKEEIYTETFVRIETEDQISTGNGLTARQDFSSYRILKPQGTIYLDEDSANTEEVAPSKSKPDTLPKKVINRKVTME